jgi:hypothetical protein
MSRSTRRASAVALTAALVGVGFAVASPALAVTPARSLPPGVSITNAGTLIAPDYTVEVDCSLIPGDVDYDYDTQFYYADLAVPAGSSVTVQTANCSDVYLDQFDYDDTRATATYTPVGGALDGDPQVQGVDWSFGDIVSLDTTEYVVGPNTQFVVLDGDFATGYFNISVPLAVTVADPQGDLIDDITLVIPDNATADLIVTDDAQYYDGDGDLALGGTDGCGITEGNHFYAEQEIVIDKRGIYTFRIADLSPISQDVDFQAAELYLEDPFLALYSSFNPADGHQGVVGCNDDADLDEFSDWNITSSGTMISDRYSQYTVELQPGTYTLVLTSYDDESEFIDDTLPVSAGERAADPKGAFSPTALGVNESATIELWYAESALAATGPSPVSGGMLAVGLALMTLGGLVFATRRLWSRA